MKIETGYFRTKIVMMVLALMSVFWSCSGFAQVVDLTRSTNAGQVSSLEKELSSLNDRTLTLLHGLEKYTRFRLGVKYYMRDIVGTHMKDERSESFFKRVMLQKGETILGMEGFESVIVNFAVRSRKVGHLVLSSPRFSPQEARQKFADYLLKLELLHDRKFVLSSKPYDAVLDIQNDRRVHIYIWDDGAHARIYVSVEQISLEAAIQQGREFCRESLLPALKKSFGVELGDNIEMYSARLMPFGDGNLLYAVELLRNDFKLSNALANTSGQKIIYAFQFSESFEAGRHIDMVNKLLDAIESKFDRSFYCLKRDELRSEWVMYFYSDDSAKKLAQAIYVSLHPSGEYYGKKVLKSDNKYMLDILVVDKQLEARFAKTNVNGN